MPWKRQRSWRQAGCGRSSNLEPLAEILSRVFGEGSREEGNGRHEKTTDLCGVKLSGSGFSTNYKHAWTVNVRVSRTRDRRGLGLSVANSSDVCNRFPTKAIREACK